MKIDALVAEIGSTTTVINAFDGLDSDQPKFLGSGQSPTTVSEGDVTIGLDKAMVALKQHLGVEVLEAKETFASSSAAGGLKMSVHGLVYDMTVKAAKEAALGAGANLRLITAGILDDETLHFLIRERPNMIMIAGGVDYGERKTALENARKIAALALNIPVIYAGNIQNQAEIRQIFEAHHQQGYLYLSDNVYPKIDVLSVEKTRKIIQDVFETHIIHAPGMEKVKTFIKGHIIPTPGAVMEASILLQKSLGDLVTIDVGGATTDIHSVTEGSKEIEKIMTAPEPFAKRTVEGDLGVYINRMNIVEGMTEGALLKVLNIDQETLNRQLNDYQPIPEPAQIPLTEQLTRGAMSIAIMRHSGRLVSMYTGSGKMTYAEGKDLTNVRYLIATGGALTRLPNRLALIRSVLENGDKRLLKPPLDTQILIDNHYIMASLGVLSKSHPEAALKLLLDSLEIR